MMPYTTIHPAMHEEVVHTNQIPLSEFVDHFDSFAGRSFPSHWHHELEIQLIVKGRAKYNVNGQITALRRAAPFISLRRPSI